jgi:hypothetical protein
MSEQDYERMVESLERRHAATIKATALHFIRAHNEHGSDPEVAHDDAKAAVENVLFSNLEWEPVKATDISDIAYEAATAAQAELR